MSHEITTRTIRESLRSTFAELDAWFERDERLRRFKPTLGDWSVEQVLEHITLTNHFLMLTLRKKVGVAVRRAQRGDVPTSSESDLELMGVIGERGSFDWQNPDHMTPTGTISAADVRLKLRKQLDECLETLENIRDGIGALCQIKMSVNDLGRIDLYQWLFFLVQHARRHLHQLAEIEEQFRAQAANRAAD